MKINEKLNLKIMEKKKLDVFRPYYAVPGLYVAFDGKTVKREYPDKSNPSTPKTERMRIIKDKDGNYYVFTEKGKTMVDLMVATCYCPPATDGTKMYVIHKDKDKKNCHRFNLKFVTRDEYRDFYRSELTYTDEKGESWLWSREDYYVTSSGKVQYEKKDLDINFLISDSDLGRCVAVSPYVCLGWQRPRLEVEELVADAYCPKLEKVPNQEFLHIDGDMMNCSASNLKWVKPDDPDYIAYMEKRKKDIEALNLQYDN